ncbi:MAG: AraC family transcriptional regulator [Microbacteriaceae bacterium]|nr:AraC family transcriptional regulator [Microbacteriaceae bacterium]
MSTPGIPAYGFHTSNTITGFEALRLETLLERMPRRALHRAHRVDFHTLILFTTGTTRISLDFVEHDCSPGTLLWMRPGQVRRFEGWTPDARGSQVLFTPEFPPPLTGHTGLLSPTGTGFWAPAAHPPVADSPALRSAFAALETEQNRPEGASLDVLRFQLGALLLMIDRLPSPLTPATDSATLMSRFRELLEELHPHTRSVADYAHALGYSPKTLDRAARLATGRSAKQLIDDRAALEARRLLAHTDDTVTQIAAALGFSEPSNFVKFLRRTTGQTPTEFRTAWNTPRSGTAER